MSDALVIVAAVPGRYPSVNGIGADAFRGGKKSPAYHDLFAAVKRAAELEMERVGWACAEYLCEVSVTFYHADGRRRDCSNLAKCELDALTAAGVWLDDSFARPVHLAIEYDPGATSRVVILVRRRLPEHIPTISTVRALVQRTRRAPPAAAPVAIAQTRDKRVAYVDGKPVPVEEALRQIRSGRMR